MTHNEKAAHAVAFPATRKLRDTMFNAQKVYAAAKAEYDEATAEWRDVYDVLYETELNKLGGK